MDLEALARDVGDLQREGFMQPQASARDGGEGDLVVEGGSRGKEPPDLLDTEDGGETVGGLRRHEREGVPVALEDRLREEADATGADAHGRWGKAIDVCAVPEGALQLSCRAAVGGCVVALREQADFPDIGRLGALALATEWQCSNPVVTQWGPKLAPFVSGRFVRVRRKTS
jgi:hypothetical protein